MRLKFADVLKIDLNQSRIINLQHGLGPLQLTVMLPQNVEMIYKITEMAS